MPLLTAAPGLTLGSAATSAERSSVEGMEGMAEMCQGQAMSAMMEIAERVQALYGVSHTVERFRTSGSRGWETH